MAMAAKRFPLFACIARCLRQSKRRRTTIVGRGGIQGAIVSPLEANVAV
jgi:hypothetical protein